MTEQQLEKALNAIDDFFSDELKEEILKKVDELKSNPHDMSPEEYLEYISKQENLEEILYKN